MRPPLAGGRRVPTVAPSLSGPPVDPEDPACFRVVVALTHELEIYLSLTSQAPGSFYSCGSRSPLRPLNWGVAMTTRTQVVRWGD